MTRCWDDKGQVAGIEVLPFGFLIFVMGALLLTNAWAVVDTKMAITSAAREATRFYVEAPDEQTAIAGAHQAASAAMAGQGHPSDHLEITIRNEAGWGRCSRITVEARTEVPAIGLPFIGGFDRTFVVRASHSEVVDPYRSGLPGQVVCDD